MTKEEYFDYILEILSDVNNINCVYVKIWYEVFTLQQCLINYNVLTENIDWAEVLKNTLINKCKDYTAVWTSPFKNFENYELVGVSVEQWIKTRIVDKVSRIRWLINNATMEWNVKWESLADSRLDLAWYITILYIYKEYADEQ